MFGRSEDGRKGKVPMRRICISMALFVCVAVLLPTGAQAAKCGEGDWHWQCTIYPATKETGKYYNSQTGQWFNRSCGCRQSSSDAGPGSYGHAEIHKKNVPTVQPSGGIGPMDVARRPLRYAPRAPLRGGWQPSSVRRGAAF